MAYGSKNPKFSTEILTDQAAGAVSNAPTGAHRLVNRNGALFMKDSSGTEVQVGLASAAGLAGRTDGTAVAAGYVGEVISTAIASSIVTVSADTYVDGQTVTLHAGVWRLDLLAAVELSWVAATPTPVAVAAIKTGSTIIGRNVIKAGQLTSTTDTTLITPITVFGYVNISADTTYKVSLVCSVANTSATARIYADATNFSGTNVTNDAKLIAVRIA